MSSSGIIAGTLYFHIASAIAGLSASRSEREESKRVGG